MNLSSVYEHSPIAVQNLLATGYGLRQLPRRHGGEFRRHVRELEAREWWALDHLQTDQDSRLRSLMTWCGARVPYYRALFRELGLDPRDIRGVSDLSALPILDKETVRATPERFVPDEPHPRLVAQTTGGTTGTPLRYWASVDAVRFNYAVYEARTRRWAGVALGDRMASFHGQPIVPAHDQAGPFWRRNLAFNQVYFSVYHLNDATLPGYIDELARFAPRVLVGYTSAIHRIAVHLLETGDTGRLAPHAVIVSSEALLPQARHDMELAFGCRVFNAYSLGELVAYVSECEMGELHISTEYGVVELVGDGDQTEIVATGLMNYGMPLLRYRTGDLAMAANATASRCERGLPMLSELIGRVDDVVVTPEGSVVGPAPMSLAFQRVPNVRRAQVIQESAEQITVLLEVAAEFTAENEEFLIVELRRRLGNSLRIVVEHVETIPRTSGGKERLVISTLNRRSGVD